MTKIFTIAALEHVRGPLEIVAQSRTPSSMGRDWRRSKDHWKVTVVNTVNGATFCSDFYNSVDYCGEPTAFDMILAWASDVLSVRNAADFAEWAEEAGMISEWRNAEDVRTAEETYDLLNESADDFLTLIGDVDIDTLLDEDELAELCE